MDKVYIIVDATDNKNEILRVFSDEDKAEDWVNEQLDNYGLLIIQDMPVNDDEPIWGDLEGAEPEDYQ